MSSREEIVFKISETQQMIHYAEQELVGTPRDPILVFNIQSLYRRLASLEEEFVSAAKTERLDICEYHLLPNDVEEYPINSIGSILTAFQRSLSVIFDSRKFGHKKKRSRVSTAALDATRLNLAYTLSGSLGIVLTIPSERMLIENALQESIRTLIEMLKSESSDQIYHFAQELGSACINSLYDLVSSHTEGSFGLDLQWISQATEFARLTLGGEHFVNLKLAIEETSEEISETLQLEGTLVGADTESNSFHMTFKDRLEIRGQMNEKIWQDRELRLPAEYKVVVICRSRKNYATQEDVKEYFLESLQ